MRLWPVSSHQDGRWARVSHANFPPPVGFGDSRKFRCCAAAYKSLARHLEACTGLRGKMTTIQRVTWGRMQSNAACKMGRLLLAPPYSVHLVDCRVRMRLTPSVAAAHRLLIFFGLISRIPESRNPHFLLPLPASASCFHFLLPLSSF